MRDRLVVLAALFRMIAARRLWWVIPFLPGLLLVLALGLLAGATPLAPLLYPLF